jgi:predicted DNA-binding transcriptional regulator YafY
VNRIDRLMATILLLQGRRVITAEDIAGHFEISLRTVYRDIAALSEGGVPIVAEAGVGYSLLNGYSMPPVMFTPEEASALFMGGHLVEHLTDPSLEAQMRSALLKIRSVLPRGHQDRLDRLQRSTAFLAGPPPGPDGESAVLTRIQSALAQRRVLEITYQTKGEGPAKRREVEPLGLVFYSDRWHLIGYCRMRRDFRDFRTDRITALSVRTETFEGHPDFSLRDHIDTWREAYERKEIIVRVARPVLDRFRRACYGGTVEERWEGDWLRATILSDECDYLAGWMLSFGTSLEVVEPMSLRERLVAMARRWMEHHAAGSQAWEPGSQGAGAMKEVPELADVSA